MDKTVNTSIKSFIREIPKAELHVHLEGTIEPEMKFKIARRNNIRLKHGSIEALRSAYEFNNLRDFLSIYNEGTKILKTPQDFYDITLAYLEKCHEQNIRHAEIFIDFQTYKRRGIEPAVQMEGILPALKEGEKRFGISTELIHCFLRHLGAEAAEAIFDDVLLYRDNIIGVGLASSENGYPPELFTEVFRKAREYGFKTVAHAGEEGPWYYVQNSIDYLKVDRIDHGNKSCENEALVKLIIQKQIPLTLCPLSNIKLKNVDNMENHTMKKMLERQMLITINSDDPAYFGGYVNENYEALASTFQLNKAEIFQLAKNSFKASFISEKRRKLLIEELDAFYTRNKEI